jgi:2',3'-cyclic-nucleotide 2'-phosphodiesterase (5'-nucleotidase family)
VARRAAEITLQREHDPDLLLLSAGDFYGDKGILDMYRGRFLSEKMRQMGYTAVALGERELTYGLRPILEDAESGLPVICANLYRGGEPVFSSSIVLRVRGWKVGVFALLDEDLRNPGELELRDPVDLGAQVVGQLEKEGCDVIVLLAHMRKERLIEIIPELQGVDIVIRGHGLESDETAADCADTVGGVFETLHVPVFFAGDRGRIMGKLVLAPSEENSYAMQSELVYLDKSVAEDSAMVGDLEVFFEGEAVRRREIKMNEFISRDETSGAIRERYLGQDVCFRCHEDLLARFALSRHFRAFESLGQRGEETNEKCLPCHTTGFGRYSGYDPVTEERIGKDLRGVQCEECHGPGTQHSRDGYYRNAAKNSCKRCHTSQWSPDFDYTVFWERLPHCEKENTD